MKYSLGTVGQYFMHDGEMYKCVAYCEQPTITFVSLESDKRVSGAVNSRCVQNFKKVEVKD